MSSARTAEHRPGLPIWTRMLALAALPIVGISLVAAPVIRDRREVADGARATERTVTALNQVFELRYALAEEMIPVEARLRVAAYGLDLQLASVFLGFDIGAALSTDRARVDQLLTRLPADLPLRATATAALEVARNHSNADGADAEAVHEEYTALADEVTSATADLLVQTRRTGGTSGAETHLATDHLEQVTALIDAAYDERDQMFRIVAQSLTTDVDVDGATRVLVAAHDRYRRSFARLRTEGVAELAHALDTLDADVDAAAFDAAVDRAIGAKRDESAGTTTPQLAQIADAFRSSFVRADLLRDLAATTTTYTAAVTKEQRRQATTALRNVVLLLLGLSVVTVSAALMITRSITQRLRRLADRARAVSEGVLDGPAADESGPREISVVAGALNHTVATLRHIEAQATALSRGQLDDPVLATPGVGALGASVHTTVLELSKAWRKGEDLQQRLAHQANHDLLTSLPNRKAALEALEHALARANRHGDAVWVLFCDLDGFKRANDTFGHHVGDRVLRTCAERLAASVRGGDVVARLGGDEFVVITERLSSAREAAELARRLIDVVGEPIELDGLSTRVGLSVGIGMSLDGHATALDLLRDADNAVHRAKKLGKGRYEVFDEQARDELARHNELEHALRHALDHGDLHLHYQLVTDTVTGAVQGLEALCRWERDGVPVSPADFIPVAEQSDLINDLGRWALGSATRQLADWTTEGKFAEAYIAVNVSGRHLLSASLVDDVRAALDESGLDPRRLVIEITETVIVSDLVTAVAHLEAVRALGVRVALDDFGTGYTSIGQLWRLPIDVLKIDGSFIRHLETAHDHVIVELMIEVAHTLGLGLVAEGVETASQQATLRELRCDAIQGFLIARPQPPDRVVTTV